VLYHALNGIRIMLVDFWAQGVKYQKQLLWVICSVWVVVMIPGAYFMLLHTIKHYLGTA
jgi:succinate dehydrogenase / fumarate reductase cytochrome b subunit